MRLDPLKTPDSFRVTTDVLGSFKAEIDIRPTGDVIIKRGWLTSWEVSEVATTVQFQRIVNRRSA